MSALREGPPSAPEPPEARLKRLRMRAAHRGIREMDLVLGGFAARQLAALPAPLLDAFDRLLAENDHDIYAWVAGAAAAPAEHVALIARIEEDLAAHPAGAGAQGFLPRV